MNNFINFLWEYKLEVIPMDLTKDMNYRFRVIIGESGDYADDVSLVSSSQQEVIDLAFRVVSMGRLGLTDTPFILDEFARTFDIIHANKAFDVVDILAKEFSQVFIVSHFNTTYERLKHDSDVSLLTKGYLEDIFMDRDDKITIGEEYV
jgi:hypothetical protein